MHAPSASKPILEQQILSRLQNCDHAPLRRVTFDMADDALTLRGSVPTFYLKQIAQTLVKSISGVERIVNSIEVHPPKRPTSR